jgi:hypothetical protein
MESCRFTELKDYKRLGRALQVANGRFEVTATLDVGPRLIRFALPGGPNVLEDEAPVTEALEGDTWRIYGGHRVWHSPEAFPRSYSPDNSPVDKVERLPDGLSLHQAEEPWTHIRKSLEVHLAADRVRVLNTLTNCGAWPVELAVWSLTVGSRGGREVIPVTQANTGLLPNRLVALWPGMPMTDRRVHWGERYIVVDCDPLAKDAFKLGVPDEHGWAAYFNHDQCLLLKFQHQRRAAYPDFGCSWETFTAGWGIELESLSPLTTLKPGRSVSHAEEWFLCADVPKPPVDEEAIARTLAPLAAQTGIELPVVRPFDWKQGESDD